MTGQDIGRLARSVIAAGQRILVVGAKPSNIGEWHHIQEDNLVFFGSTGRKLKHWNVPANVGLVILTRFHKHEVLQSLKKGLSKGAVLWPKHLGTGELKVLLEQAFGSVQVKVPLNKYADRKVALVELLPVVLENDLNPNDSDSNIKHTEMVEENVMTEKSIVEKPVRGSTAQFVRENADFGVVPSGAEVERLFNLAESRNLGLLKTSIEASFYAQKRGPKATKSPATSAKNATGSKSRHDAIKVLTSFCEDIQLVGVAILEVLEENKDLKEQVRRLEQIREASKGAIRNTLKTALANLK